MPHNSEVVPQKMVIVQANNQSPTATPDKSSSSAKYRPLKITFFVIFAIGLVCLFSIQTAWIKALAMAYVEQICSGGFRAVGFCILTCIIATILFVPGIVLVLCAGFAFDMAYGNIIIATSLASVSVFVGVCFGSALAFLIGRHVFKGCLRERAERNKTFHGIEVAIEKKGLKMLLLVRLCPVIPYNILNYLLGTTNISFLNYNLASFGMLPGIVFFCYLGAMLCSFHGALSGKTSTGVGTLYAIAIVGVLVIMCICYIGHATKKEIDKITKELTGEEATTVVPYDDSPASLTQKDPEQYTSRVSFSAMAQ